jgi:hypothetical protein
LARHGARILNGNSREFVERVAYSFALAWPLPQKRCQRLEFDAYRFERLAVQVLDRARDRLGSLSQQTSQILFDLPGYLSRKVAVEQSAQKPHRNEERQEVDPNVEHMADGDRRSGYSFSFPSSSR